MWPDYHRSLSNLIHLFLTDTKKVDVVSVNFVCNLLGSPSLEHSPIVPCASLSLFRPGFFGPCGTGKWAGALKAPHVTSRIFKLSQ